MPPTASAPRLSRFVYELADGHAADLRRQRGAIFCDVREYRHSALLPPFITSAHFSITERGACIDARACAMIEMPHHAIRYHRVADAYFEIGMATTDYALFRGGDDDVYGTYRYARASAAPGYRPVASRRSRAPRPRRRRRRARHYLYATFRDVNTAFERFDTPPISIGFMLRISPREKISSVALLSGRRMRAYNGVSRRLS